jgi:hypothetical protein
MSLGLYLSVLFLIDAGLPPLELSAFLPQREFCHVALQMNADYRRLMNEQYALRSWDAGLEAVLIDTERRRKIWDAADDVQCRHRTVIQRRESLLKLMGLMGWRSYLEACGGASKLPFPIPFGGR